MKRSEMINEMIDLIDDSVQRKAHATKYELMSSLLRRQEELGMSPPETLFGNLWHHKWEDEPSIVEVLREEREKIHSVAIEDIERRNS